MSPASGSECLGAGRVCKLFPIVLPICCKPSFHLTPGACGHWLCAFSHTLRKTLGPRNSHSALLHQSQRHIFTQYKGIFHNILVWYQINTELDITKKRNPSALVAVSPAGQNAPLWLNIVKAIVDVSISVSEMKVLGHFSSCHTYVLMKHLHLQVMQTSLSNHIHRSFSSAPL